MAEKFEQILAEMKANRQAAEQKASIDLQKKIAEDKKNFIDLAEKLENTSDKNARDTIQASMLSIEESQAERAVQKDFRTEEKKDVDDQKAALERLRQVIEGQGGKAEENKEFNRESLKIQMQELNMRKKLAGSASAREEIEKERRAAIDKQGSLLQKISSGIMGIGSSMKEKALTVGKGLFSIIKGTLFAGLLIAFANFLKSPQFGEMIDYLTGTIIPNIIDFYNNTIKPFGASLLQLIKNIATFIGDPSFENFKNIFNVDNPAGLIVGLAGITALLAPKLLFKGLKAGIRGLTSAFTMAGNQLTDLGGGVTRDSAGKARQDGRIAKDPRKAGLGSRLGNVAKGALKGAKFLPAIGLAVTAISGVFDGITAGMREAEKENSTKLSVFKEATAGVLSGLTFGLISQEDISNTFSSVGDKIQTGFTKIKEDSVMMFDKFIGPDAEWSKNLTAKTTEAVESLKTSVSTFATDLKTTTTESVANLKTNITTLATDIKTNLSDKFTSFKESIPSLDEVKNSITSFGDDISIKFTEGFTTLKDKLPDFDKVGATLNKFGDDVKNKFESITGIEIPSFDDVQAGLSNLGANLSEKFKGITGIDLGEKFDQLTDMLPDIGNPFSGILKQLNESEFFKDAKLDGFSFSSPLASVKGILKNTLTDLFDIQTAERGGSVGAGGMVLVGERGPEIMRMGNQPAQIMSAERTNQMMKSGSGGMNNSAPIIVNAPTTTNAPVNNNSTNVASTTFVEPDPIFRRITQYAI